MNIIQSIPSTVGTQTASTNLGKMNSWGYEVSVSWRDKIGKDFKYHVGINTGYSDNEVLLMDFEDEYNYRQIRPGDRTDIGLWGMQCIGMFRSFQDINEYFDRYMKKADGTYGTYMGMSKDDVRPGMLIYKDVRGAYDPATDTYAGPDGIVDDENDQVELGHRSNPYGFTINGGASWKDLSITFQLGASWGGYATVTGKALKPEGSLEYCNMPSFWNPDNMFVYQDIYDGSGNLLMQANRGAKYPNLAYSSVNAVTSSFWRISAARAQLSRVTLAYTLPSAFIKKLGVQNARISVTGQNLISFYNPNPDNFMDPMAGAYGNYPNLRTWDIGINLTF